ncbi:type II toxin-antitoxin system toxin DNA ADP-ribosyl transferase DarT [Avibacterium avium]|uniref:type II toxin-antitoxin system toxin DNA ADP-ribosyl transferase DarT n=1 Tax=Avibacterium avium TaxID=751 RepID=UPI003BF87D32
MIPSSIKIYHIIHVDKLASVIQLGGLLSDAQVQNHCLGGTVIGMSRIKQRRLEDLTLESHHGLHVGECVPFYFCPRSIMLFMIKCQNPELDYQGGQGNIIHLQADFHKTIQWADAQKQRWAFTTSNAGARSFEDYCQTADLDKINWQAVNARYWQDYKHGKQAEFLLEQQLPWHLIEHIGVFSDEIYTQVESILNQQKPKHRPTLSVEKSWYY